MYYHGKNRLPEFEGYRGRTLQINMTKPKMIIQPRRYNFPVGFENDWQKIGSKRTKVLVYEDTMPAVEC